MSRLCISKDTFEFMKHPTIARWLTNIHAERTAQTYSYELMRFLREIGKTPDEFLADVESAPKPTAIMTKAHLGELAKKSSRTASTRSSAIKSFTRFYEADLPMNGLKIRVVRTRRKPRLPWTDAMKIIAECRQPYRSIFEFMAWSGLGCDEFTEIQNSTELQADIERQRKDDAKNYIRIDLRPRKSNLDTFYTLVPKQFVPTFPLRTNVYGAKGGQLIDILDLEESWTRACKRAKLYLVGRGPHSLRSAFRSACAESKVEDAVAEYVMGHGPRDKHGYSREVENDAYVVAELSKLWKGTTTATTAELDEANRKIAEQESRIRELEAIVSGWMKHTKAVVSIEARRSRGLRRAHLGSESARKRR